jgi:predicted Zn-dependent peptidase
MESSSLLPVLPNDPALLIGTLASGLRFAFQPNAYANRLVAHLTINTGSVCETDEEQGIAHVLEHAVFLGTARFPDSDSVRAELARYGMAYNADSNASTDYRETIFTLSGPAMPVAVEGEAVDPRGNLPALLGMLQQLVFAARLEGGAPLENELSSVLSEAAMRNSVEFRVECAATALVHAEPANPLPRRLPIGLPSLIKGFAPPALRAFYERWYRPEYCTIVVAGNIGSVEAMRCITEVFGSVAADGAGQGVNAIAPPFAVAPTLPAYPNPHTLIPHALHAPSPRTPLAIAQHPLLHAFGLSLTLKRPLADMQCLTKEQWTEAVADIIMADIFDARVRSLRAGVGARAKAGRMPPGEDAPLSSSVVARPVFNSIGMGQSASPGEGCSYEELSVGSDMRLEGERDDAFDGGPADESELWGAGVDEPAWFRLGWSAHGGRGHVWQRAVAVAVREALRFGRYGPGAHEFATACRTYLRNARDVAATADSVDTEELVEEIEEGIRTGSAMPSRRQESSWIAHCLGPDGGVTLAFTRARAAANFRSVEAAVNAAVSRIEDVSAGSVRPDAAWEGAFASIPAPATVFVCASGPQDTVSGAREGPAGLESDLIEGQPGLMDRLGGVGRRAKLRALLMGDANLKDGEEGEEEGEEGEGDEEGTSTGSSPKKARLAAVEEEGHLYPFAIDPLEVLAAIAHGSVGVFQSADVTVPSHLVPSPVLEQRTVEARAAHAASRRPFPYGYIPLTAWPPAMAARVQAAPRTRIEEADGGSTRVIDEVTGVVTRVLSNGLSLAFRRTAVEPAYVSLSLEARGGDSAEGVTGWVAGVPAHGPIPDPSSPYYGPLSYGTARDPVTGGPWIPVCATSLGLSTMIASGAAGLPFDALMRVAGVWGIASSASSGRETVRLSVGVVAPRSAEDAGEPSPVSRALELMHAYLTSSTLQPTALARERDDSAGDTEASSRSLETLTVVAAARSAFAPDLRFDLASKEARLAITLPDCIRALTCSLLLPANLQLVVAGDFREEELEAAVLEWLGPLLPPPASSLPCVDASGGHTVEGFVAYPHPCALCEGEALQQPDLPAVIAPSTWLRPFPSLPSIVLRGRVVRVPAAGKDATPRAMLHIVLPFPGMYQALPTNSAIDTTAALAQPWPALRAHPMYLLRARTLAAAVINNRLYRALRDDTGLCYAVSFSFATSELSHGTYGEVSCTPLPTSDAPPRALARALAVLSAFLTSSEPVTEAELGEVLKPLLEGLRSDEGRSERWARAAMHLYGAGGFGKAASWSHEVRGFYAAFTLEELRAAIVTNAAALPSPLPLHVAVGVTGSLTFLRGTGGEAGGGPRKGGAAGGGGGQVLPLPGGERLEREWAALVERTVAAAR